MAQIQIIECRTRAQMRAFLSLGEKKRLFEPEKSFVAEKDACDAGRNALLRAHKHIFLLAEKDGKAAARLLLIDGGERAWFSLFAFRDEEAALALTGKAKEKAADWGAVEICGPVSPDGSGFMLGAKMSGLRAADIKGSGFMSGAKMPGLRAADIKRSGFMSGAVMSGIRTADIKESGLTTGAVMSGLRAADIKESESMPGTVMSGLRAADIKERGSMPGAVQRHAPGVSSPARAGAALDTGSSPWHPCDASVAPVLEKAGFLPETLLGELEIFLAGRKNPYAGAAGFAMRHGGIIVRRMRLGTEGACRAAYCCCADAHERGYEAFAGMTGRIAQLNRRAFALVAFRGDEPAGWLLCAPEQGRLRLLHMQVPAQYRRGPSAAALLERAWQEALTCGEYARASTIDLENGASLRMAMAAGGRIKSVYGIYLCKISPESAG